MVSQYTHAPTAPLNRHTYTSSGPPSRLAQRPASGHSQSVSALHATASTTPASTGPASTATHVPRSSTIQHSDPASHS